MASIAASALLIGGCVTVESTRAKLESGNPTFVAQAEDAIVQNATSRQLSSQERISYINLTSNPKVLSQIFTWARYERDIGLALAQRMNFSQKGSMVEFLTEHEKHLRDSMTDDKVRTAVVSSMLATASLDELNDVAKRLATQNWNMRCEELNDRLMVKLAEKTTDQVQLASLLQESDVCISRETEYKKIALSKLTDQKLLMSLYSNRKCFDREQVFAKLADDTILEFVQTDPRYGVMCKYTEEYAKDAARMLVGRIAKQNSLAMLVAKGKSASVRLSALQKLSDEDQIVRAAKEFTFDFKKDDLKDVDKELLKLVKKDRMIDVFKANPMLMLYAGYRDQVKTADNAKYILEHADLSLLNANSIDFAWLVVLNSVKLLDEGTVNGLYAKARSRIDAAAKQSVVFNGFYLGMPVLDYFILMRKNTLAVEQIYAMDIITPESCQPSKEYARKDWQTGWVMDRLIFTRKQKYKLFEVGEQLSGIEGFVTKYVNAKAVNSKEYQIGDGAEYWTYKDVKHEIDVRMYDNGNLKISKISD